MPQPNQRGGRGGRPANREVTVSKALSLLLRHAAEREGLKIDSQGYANVADVLAWRKLKSLLVTFSEIMIAVETSDKKRFALLYLEQSQSQSQSDPSSSTSKPTPTTTDGEEQPSTESQNESATATALAASKIDSDPTHYLIRATQGHSIKSVEAEALLEKLALDNVSTLPETVVHGTYHSTWPQILDSGGIRCMGRNHAHFAAGPDVQSVLAAISPPGDSTGNDGAESGSGAGSGGKVISGMRQDAAVLIYIDIRKALEGGCPFWRSENGVILSEGMTVSGQEGLIPVEFFDVVVERRKGLGKIWEGGETLQELPGELTRKGNPKGRGKKR